MVYCVTSTKIATYFQLDLRGIFICRKIDITYKGICIYTLYYLVYSIES